MQQVLGKTRSADNPDSRKLLVALYEHSSGEGGGGGGGGSSQDMVDNHPDPHSQDNNHDNNTTTDIISVSSRPRLRRIKSWSNTSSDDEEEDEDGRSETSRMDGQSYGGNSRARSVDGDSVAETHCSLKTFNTVESYNTNASTANVSKSGHVPVNVTHPKPALSLKDKASDKDKGIGQVSPWGTKFTWGSSQSLNTQAITVSSFLNCNHNDNPLGLDEEDYPLPVSSRQISR